MAEKKQEAGLGKLLSDWWSSESAPPPPSRIPAVDPRTGNRTKPSPKFSWTGEGFGNIYRELQRSHLGFDYLRDLAKSTGKAAGELMSGKRTIPGYSQIVDFFHNAGDAVNQFYAARDFERTGQWPKYNPSDMSTWRSQSPEWRAQAMKIYKGVASMYSYVDPKTKQRTTDWSAINRAISNDPVGTIAPLLAGGAGALGKFSKGARLASEASEAAGKRSQARVLRGMSATGKGLQIAGETGARVLNPAGTIIAVAAKPVVRAASRAIPVKILDKDGNFTPKFEEALRREGYDPDIYSTPEAKAHFQDVIGKNGISPASIRKAVGTSEGVPVTRSMALRERAPSEFSADVAAARQTGADLTRQQMEQQFGVGPDQRDLGNAFARSYTDARNQVAQNYNRAFSHRGVFTNTDSFTSGVRDAINAELGALGLDIDTVMRAPRFEQTQNVLGGFRRGDRRFGGIFQQFDDLAGASAARPLQAADLSGEMHTFDPARQRWVNANGTPAPPAKAQYLDAVSNRPNIPATPPGQNGLTPQNIDGIRRDVNSLYRNAEEEDRLALSAINRGIDKYIETNAANFTGDGAALSRDLSNARAANQSFIGNFDQSPNKVIRDASRITSANTAPDENGMFRFNGDVGSIGAHLENRIIDPNTLQSKVNYSGGNTVTGDKVFSDLYNIMDPEGQNALVSHVRNVAATSPASPEVVGQFVGSSAFFAPSERDAILRMQNARGISTGTYTAPSTFNDSTASKWGARFTAPVIGHNIGTGIGGYFGAPQIGGTLGMMAGSALESRGEDWKRASRLKRELETIPMTERVNPDLFNPLTGAVAVTGVSGQSPFLQRAPQPAPAPTPTPTPAPQVAAPAPQTTNDPYALPTGFETPAPKQAAPRRDPYALPAGFEETKEDPYALPEGFEGNQGMYRGGRTAYKAGGKVQGKNIEPLVRALMTKAKQAKKVSNKATEPLLNAHDDAIASALKVAQDSI